jgi:hypothetical protein
MKNKLIVLGAGVFVAALSCAAFLLMMAIQAPLPLE